MSDETSNRPKQDAQQIAALDLLQSLTDRKKEPDWAQTLQMLSEVEPALLASLDPLMLNYALTMACMRQKDPSVAIILVDRAGIDPNILYGYSHGQKEASALCVALLSGNWACATELLARLKSPPILDGRGFCALACAAQGMEQPDPCMDRSPCPQNLLELLATASSPDNLSWIAGLDSPAPGSSLAHFFARDASSLEWLAGLGAPMDLADSQGCRPLMRACQEGYVEAAMALVKAGADLSAKNKLGNHALHYLGLSFRDWAFSAGGVHASTGHEVALGSLLKALHDAGLGFDDPGQALSRESIAGAGNSWARRRNGAFIALDPMMASVDAELALWPVTARSLLSFEGNEKSMANLARLEIAASAANPARTSEPRARKHL